MFITFPPQQVLINELADLFPVELVDAGVGEILDETGNEITDTDNKSIYDEA